MPIGVLSSYLVFCRYLLYYSNNGEFIYSYATINYNLKI